VPFIFIVSKKLRLIMINGILKADVRKHYFGFVIIS